MVGGPFTDRVKTDDAVMPPPSVTVNVIVVMPICPVAGVTVTVRVAPVPPSTIFAVGTNVLLLEVPATINAVAGVRSSPTVKANADVARPIFSTLLPIVEIVGAPFTISLKLVLLVNPPVSVTDNVTVALPLCAASGVTVT